MQVSVTRFAGAADRVDFVLTDHLGQRETKFGRAHRSGDRHEHRATLLEMGRVAVGGILQRRGVEVAVVMLDEVGDGTRSAHMEEVRGLKAKGESS
jgi:hypothetical protein